MFRKSIATVAITLATLSVLAAPALAQSKANHSRGSNPSPSNTSNGGNGADSAINDRYVAVFERRKPVKVPYRSLASCDDRHYFQQLANGRLAAIDCIEVKRAIRPEFLAGYSCSRMLVEYGRPNVFVSRLSCTQG